MQLNGTVLIRKKHTFRSSCYAHFLFPCRLLVVHVSGYWLQILECDCCIPTTSLVKIQLYLQVYMPPIIFQWESRFYITFINHYTSWQQRSNGLEIDCMITVCLYWPDLHFLFVLYSCIYTILIEFVHVVNLVAVHCVAKSHNDNNLQTMISLITLLSKSCGLVAYSDVVYNYKQNQIQVHKIIISVDISAQATWHNVLTYYWSLCRYSDWFASTKSIIQKSGRGIIPTLLCDWDSLSSGMHASGI